MNAGRDVLGELIGVVGHRYTPPREDYQQILMAARSAWQQSLRHRRKRRLIMSIAAAALLTAAVAGTALFRAISHSPPQLIASAVVARGEVRVLLPGEHAWRLSGEGADISSGTRLQTGARGSVAVRLRNGTSVRVSHDSELAFESDAVLRLESGIVYVDTGAHRSSGTLRVDTPIGSIRDLGTAFEVRTTDDAVRIRVREGRVQLEASGTPARLEGRAGEEIELNRQGRLRRHGFSRSDPAWQWAAALAVAPQIEGQRLLQFLAWVSHETGRQLRFQGPAIEARAGTIVLHGKADGLAPLDALALVLSTTDLDFVLPSDEVIVIRRRQD